MRRLGGPERETCGCRHANAPAANSCARCGLPLGASPDPYRHSHWGAPAAPTLDIRASEIGRDRPRLWLSGGAGAWYVTEDERGLARARILDGNGMAKAFGGAILGPFAGLQSVESTRRGVFALVDDRLFAITRAPEAPFAWAEQAAPLKAPPGRIVGMAPYQDGALLLATIGDGRIALWRGSGTGPWRELASVAASVGDEAWLGLVTASGGEALFWGSGLVGAFDPGRRRLVTRSAPVAELPARLTARIDAQGAADPRAWRRDVPVLVTTAEQSLLLRWHEGVPEARPVTLPIDPVLAWAGVTDAVLARTATAVVRLAVDAEGVTRTMVRDADRADEAAAVAIEHGAAFVTVRHGDTGAEFVAGSDPARALADPLVIDRGRGARPAPAGFEPLAICGYTAHSGAEREIWLALDPGETRGEPPLQRIVRIPAAA